MDLKVGEDYTTELYPGFVRLPSTYLGENGSGEHIFQEIGGLSTRIIMEGDCMVEEEGILTHKRSSGRPVRRELN